MNRRNFLTTALAATAGGLLVPEWILDPPKGRSMVAVPQQMQFEIFSVTVNTELERWGDVVIGSGVWTLPGKGGYIKIENITAHVGT